MASLRDFLIAFTTGEESITVEAVICHGEIGQGFQLEILSMSDSVIL